MKPNNKYTPIPQEPAALSSLIEYQANSIVSRTLIDKPAGTVTLFAFDATAKLSEHTAPYDAMVYILDGEAEITVADKSYNVKEGEIKIMPANIPHSVTANTRFKMLLVMIRD